MEKMVFQSPKQYRIVAVKKLLNGNGIPVSSIKLYINVEWSHGGRRGSGRTTDVMESRDELNVPIEEFHDELNDSQTFELYTFMQYEYSAIELIENTDREKLFNDCVFKSDDYDEAFEVYLLLKRNNIRCEDVHTADDYYTVSADPGDMDDALEIIETRYGNRMLQSKESIEPVFEEYREKRRFAHLLPIILIICVLFVRVEGRFIIEFLWEWILQR